MMIVMAITGLLGAVLAVWARSARRRRVQDAAPFAGDERAAPEPVLVPNSLVYAQYLGTAIAAASIAGIVAAWA